MKLTVTNTTEDTSDDPTEYSFDKDRVTIGRGSENDLTLHDPRRIVSTEHAEIRRAGDTYQLVDRGSKNFTHFRNQRLEAGEPYDLSEGDVFRIGEFEIEFEVESPSDQSPTDPSSADQTVYADFSNPMEEPVESLVEALNDLTEAYESEAPARRDDALKDALEGTDTDVERPQAAQQAIQLVTQMAAADSGSLSAGETVFAPDASPSSSEPSAESSTAEAPPPKSSTSCKDETVDKVLDALTEALSRIVEIPWQFRHEFIGQTIMQSQETQFLYSGDAADMKQHLLDPSISQEERRQRLALVEDAAEELAVHQVAMLNGYKASVTEGVEELLNQLNPDAHKSEVTDEHPLYEYIPLLASAEVIGRLNDEWSELKRRDWSVAEQRIFRPAFIKAYLARMTAADTTRSDDRATGMDA